MLVLAPMLHMCTRKGVPLIACFGKKQIPYLITLLNMAMKKLEYNLINQQYKITISSSSIGGSRIKSGLTYSLEYISG